MIRVGNEIYRFQDEAIDAILALHRNGFCVSFFSGGERDRNVAVIQEIYDAIDRKTGHPGLYRPEKLGSFDLLTPTGAPPTARFTERFKKDLLRLFGWDALPESEQQKRLSSATLLDDHPNFIIPSEADHVVSMENSTQDLDDQPTLERNKLSRMVGALLTAKQHTRDKPDKFLVNLRRLLYFPDGDMKNRTDPDQIALTKRGLLELWGARTPFIRYPQPMLENCAELFENIIQEKPQAK